MDNKNTVVVAIDGPAGSGKSTISKIIARKLNYLYLDTGAMYRALAWKALREKLNLKDENSLVKLAQMTGIEITKDNRVLVNGIDVTKQIREPEVTRNVFYIARVAGVRKVMVSLQRKIARGQKVVVEGRDITTVVFPEAKKKIYLDADFTERVRRRYKELSDEGHDISPEKVREELHSRDREDTTRKIAPLKIADDAVVVDTTGLGVQQVAEKVLKIINE